MTLKEAKGLRPGQVLFDVKEHNYDGTPRRWKVNGGVKTWKTKPLKVRVPLKSGMWDYGYLHEGNLCLFTLDYVCEEKK